jgi:hypothetical protein
MPFWRTRLKRGYRLKDDSDSVPPCQLSRTPRLTRADCSAALVAALNQSACRWLQLASALVKTRLARAGARECVSQKVLVRCRRITPTLA